VGTETFTAFDSSGSAWKLKGRILRHLSNDPVTDADKSNIRTTLGITGNPGSGDLLSANNLDDVASKDTAKLNLEIGNIGTGANDIPLCGFLGDLAFQSSEGVSVGALKADYGTTTTGTGTAVSGVFNAYERGTFTPTIYYQNPTGLSTSYTTQSGNYVRTGDLVAIQIKLTWTVTGTPVNDNLGVRGIPFQPASEDSLACHDSQGQTALVISNGVNDILICQNSSLTSNQADNVGTGTHTIRISGTYQIA